jgi:hypothetical protein
VEALIKWEKKNRVMNFRAFLIILIVAIGLLWIRAMDAGLY